MVRIELEGETPSKKNSRINTKSGRSFPSARYTAWHESAVMQIRSQKIRPFKKPVTVQLLFIHGDRRRRDSDNGTSSILDTLVDAGVIKDDKWENVPAIIIKNLYIKDTSKCVITISEND